MIKVLMADDHAILREGLKQLFDWSGDITVAAEVSNGKQVLEKLAQGGFDILLLDMSMPAPNGLELITLINAGTLKLPILVLSMYNDPQIARKAIMAGASGYLSKDSNPEDLLTAIRNIAQGGRYLDPALAKEISL